MTAADLQALVEEWQVRLNLSHFKVWSRLMSRKDFMDYHEHDAHAFCIQDLTRQTGRIDLLDPADTHPKRLDGAPPDDPEENVVHEVMHIWSQQIISHVEALAKYAPEPVMELVRENMSKAEEHMNDALAAALVSLKRDGSK